MIYFCIAAMIWVADIFSKKWICKNIKLGDKKEIVKKRFYLWHIKNKGAAYNSFEGHMKMIKWISAFGMLFCASQMTKGNRLHNMAYSFLLGGAAGNFTERIKNGAVTDFLYITNEKKYHNDFLEKIHQKSKAIFNIADIFIFLGAFFLCIYAIFVKEK